MIFFITYFFKLIELFSTNFYEFKVYKKKPNIKNKIQNENLFSNICLVMQGPLIEKNNFTFETLKWYKNCNPQINIIFSTWKFQNKKIIDNIKSLGIDVIENDLPLIKGIVNINMQIISTISGLNLAENKNYHYVLKTRSDQRIYEYKNLFNYFMNVLKTYPIDENTILNDRLIISSLNTYQNRLYGISDMFMFGRISDMKVYWDISLQEEDTLPNELNNKYYISYKLGEGAFVMNFLSKINFNPKWDFEDNNLFYSKFFYIVDKEAIGLFWHKYNRYDGFNYFHDESKLSIFKRLTFSDWLDTYTKYKN